MTRPRRFTVAERRARLARRHCLAAPAASPADAARSLVAVHGTDPSSVYVGILARLSGATLADVDAALYSDRTLIRLLGMRRTVFAATLDNAALIQAACSDAVAARERRKLLGWLAEAGITDAASAEAWLAGAEQAALRALAARGEATAVDLAGDDPRLAEQIVLGRAPGWRPARACPAGCCSCSPPRARRSAPARAAAGPRTSTAGPR